MCTDVGVTVKDGMKIVIIIFKSINVLYDIQMWAILFIL